MLEKKDLENIKMGDNGSVSILEGINPKVQMMYCLCFHSVITEKEGKLYYVQETICKDGWQVTEIPYESITLEFLEELEDIAIENYFKSGCRIAKNPLEVLLKGNDTRGEIIYYDK